MAEHALDKSKIHHKWDNSLPPAIEIAPGDIVHCETAEVTNNQVTPGCDAAVLTSLDFNQLYPLAGPIYVRGAAPGDILEIEILRPQTLDRGRTKLVCVVLYGVERISLTLHRAVRLGKARRERRSAETFVPARRRRAGTRKVTGFAASATPAETKGS